MPAIPGLGDLLTPPRMAPPGLDGGTAAADPVALLREAVVLAHRALGGHLAALNLPALYAVNPSAECQRTQRGGQGCPGPGDPDGTLGRRQCQRRRAGRRLRRHRPLPGAAAAVAGRAASLFRFRDVPGPNAVAGEEIAVAPWCCPGLHYADLWNQQLLVSLLVDGKDRPSVRHKITVDLASDACHRPRSTGRC